MDQLLASYFQQRNRTALIVNTLVTIVNTLELIHPLITTGIQQKHLVYLTLSVLSTTFSIIFRYKHRDVCLQASLTLTIMRNCLCIYELGNTELHSHDKQFIHGLLALVCIRVDFMRSEHRKLSNFTIPAFHLSLLLAGLITISA
jgi:hypothetical protein